MLRAEDYQSEEREIQGVKVVISSYRIGERYYCKINNKDPGAQISRASAKTLEEAREIALAEANEKLK